MTKVIDSKVEEAPKNVEYWQAVGRFQPGVGFWFSCGLHRNKIDAESDLCNFGYVETRLVRIILPA
jgi:hypothetical protein